MIIFTVVFSTFKISAPFVSTGSTQVQFKPWYLFWTIPYMTMILPSALFLPAIFISFGALLRYLPFLYFGDWDHTFTTEFMTLMIIIPAILAVVVQLLIKRIKFRF
jgi:hypothetical protein